MFSQKIESFVTFCVSQAKWQVAEELRATKYGQEEETVKMKKIEDLPKLRGNICFSSGKPTAEGKRGSGEVSKRTTQEFFKFFDIFPKYFDCDVTGNLDGDRIFQRQENGEALVLISRL